MRPPGLFRGLPRPRFAAGGFGVFLMVCGFSLTVLSPERAGVDSPLSEAQHR